MTRPTEAVSDSRLASSALWHDRLRKRISPDGVRAVFACRWIDPETGHGVGPVEYEEVYVVAGSLQEPEYGLRAYATDRRGAFDIGPPLSEITVLGTWPDEADALAAWRARLEARREAPHINVLGSARMQPEPACPDCNGTGFVHSYYSNRTETCACWN